MPPEFPNIIDVVVYDVDNQVVSGVTVTAFNETTGDLITSQNTTNASGQALLDLANFPQGYSNGDWIQITAVGSGDTGKVLKFKATCKTWFAQINKLDVNYEI